MSYIYASVYKLIFILNSSAAILFCLFTTETNAQNKLVGRYHNFFGSSIVVNPDSTFKYEFHFDLESSWTKGIWTTNKDTIYFRMIPIFDTLNYVDSNGTSHDSLSLSLDENAGLMTVEETQRLYSYGQERHPCPNKLFFKRNKLYEIAPDGQLVTQKFAWANRKFAPWFVKSYKE